MTNVDEVLKLIETGANINIKDADGMTPLMHVVKNRYEWPPDRDDHYIDELNTDLFFLGEWMRHNDAAVQMIDVLFDAKADVTLKDNDGLTALEHAKLSGVFDRPEDQHQITIERLKELG